MGDRGRNPRIPAPTRMAGEEFFEVRFMRYREVGKSPRARQAAFWNGEILDRCCVSITAPRNGAGSAPSFTRDEAYYTDPQAVIAANRAQMERTYYAATPFPACPWIWEPAATPDFSRASGIISGTRCGSSRR